MGGQLQAPEAVQGTFNQPHRLLYQPFPHTIRYRCGNERSRHVGSRVCPQTPQARRQDIETLFRAVSLDGVIQNGQEKPFGDCRPHVFTKRP